MKSRLLERLDQQIALSDSEQTRVCLRAQRAGVIARLGNTELARTQLAELRGLNKGFVADLTIWILIGEGLVDHCDSLAPTARDKFRRAYAIGVASGQMSARALSAAWLANSELRAGNIVKAIELALESITVSEPEDLSALARGHLVLADCLNAIDETETALRRYSLAREFASKEGDLSIQSVALHNSAAFGLARLSIADAMGIQATEDVRMIELAVESTTNLDKLVGIQSLKSSTPLLIAQLRVVQHRWAEALAAYDQALPHAEQEDQGRWVAKYLAELALCCAHTGDDSRARTLLAEASRRIDECMDLDDLAIAHGRMSAASALLNNGAAVEQHRSAARRCYQQFQEQQAGLRRIADSLIASSDSASR